ncbi:MAG: hypothetical protein IIB33_04955 [Chloroflexi bacterium]|nr:hypothetical protein [Chloroflexota bacterium]
MRDVKGMNKRLRRRPKLTLTARQVLEAVRKHGSVTATGRELGCSGGYIHARFQAVGSDPGPGT